MLPRSLRRAVPPFPGRTDLRQMLVVSTRNGVPPEAPANSGDLNEPPIQQPDVSRETEPEAEVVPLVPRRSHHKKQP